MSAIQSIINQGSVLYLEKADKELLIEIQTKLKELLYYRGSLDGLYGPLTKRAWENFKADHHISDPDLVGPGSLKELLAAPPTQVQINQVPEAAIALIKEFEGYYSEAYPDPISGWDCPTIGWGTIKYPNGDRVKRGDTCTEGEAENYLLWEVNSLCTPALSKIPTWTQLNENQKAAIYSFA